MKPDSRQSITAYIERLLTQRIFLPLAVLMLCVLLAGTIITLWQVQERQHAQAALLTRQVRVYLDNAINVLDALDTSLPMVPEGERQVLVESAFRAYPFFDALYCVDETGRITHIASNYPAYTGWDVSAQPYFTPENRGKNPYISPPFTSPTSHHATVYISRPFEGSSLLVGELSLKALQTYLAANDAPYGGPEDVIFIIDSYNNLLAHPNSELVEQRANLGHYTTLKDQNIFLRLYRLDDRWYFGTVTPIAGTDWRVVVQTPTLPALRTHLALLSATLLMFILSGVFMSRGVKRDLTRRIVTPLKLLGQQAEALSRGQYALVARELTVPQTFQELLLLVRSFGDMASAIRMREQELEEHTRQYRLLVETSPDAIFLIHAEGHILFCNPQAERMYGAGPGELLIGRHITELVPEEEHPRLERDIQRLQAEGRVNNIMLHFLRKNGERYPAEANAALLRNGNGNPDAYIVMVRDISARQRNAAFTAFLIEVTRLALQSDDLNDILQNTANLLAEYFNATTCYITLWDEQRALSIPTAASGELSELYPTLAARPGDGTLTHAVISAGRVLAIEDVHDSAYVAPQIAITIPETSFLALPFISGAQKMGAALIGFQRRRTFTGEEIHRGAQIARQISLALAKTHLLQSERRRRQEAEKLRQVTTTLTSSLELPVVLEHILDALAAVLPYDRSTIFLQQGNVLEVVALRGNQAHTSLLGMTIPRGGDALTDVIESTRKPLTLPDASQDVNFMGWGGTADTRGWMGIPLMAHDEIIGYLTIDSLQPNTYGPEEERLAQAFANQAAIAIENARLYAQKQEALERTSNLYRMARRLISTTNLPELLQIIANDVQMALFGQICTLLLFDLQTLHIEQHVHSGFGIHIHAPHPELLLSGLHGEALRRGMAQLAVVAQPNEEVPLLHQMYATNEIHSVMIAPLNTRRGIIGSIIVSNAPGQKAYTPADLDLLTTISHQASIAIQNLNLVADLQQSNRDLTLAYDATIEGWSRALELRDKETQGHTLRVTDLTLKLAQAMGLRGETLTHIRRGALLHDIGKMGIPDAILLKPGPLTEAEWEVMKRHPVYAYEMLHPIQYLRPALHIPYCHHERWNGSGYPRGLKEEAIPLEARIFAVVDVWDALTSDRPYREAAWDMESVLAHLRRYAGVLFDPLVVETFEHMMRVHPPEASRAEERPRPSPKAFQDYERRL